MRDASFFVSGLLDLPKLREPAERLATWRQSVTSLGRTSSDDGPGPLDGLHPEALLLGVRTALEEGLVDDLGWLEAPKAGAALYELASALPLGPEQRELGRRILTRLHEGNAETFAVMATRMAVTTGRGLGTQAVRARVALVTELPISAGVPDGPLALALAQRRELARDWIEVPSTGSLPARRLAARLLERAAREAARRASQGDRHALRVFNVEAIRGAFLRLLADRESLVWRHVAVARGLLSPWVPELRVEIDSSMSREKSPTEWRRGATSMAASIAVDVDFGTRGARALLSGGALERDSGVATALVWGLPRAAEAEPDAAGELLGLLVHKTPHVIAEAVAELGAEYGDGPFVEAAAERLLEALGGTPPSERDDGAAALLREVMRDLDRAPRDDEPVREQLARALDAFVMKGARAAFGAACQVLEAVTGAVLALEAIDDGGEGRTSLLARRASLVLLRDLDLGLLERGVLQDLLCISPAGEVSRAHNEALDSVRERLASWVLARESLDATSGPPDVTHATLRLRRLRALLHLVDSDVGGVHDDGRRAAKLRERWRRIAKALTARFESEPPNVLHRTVSAALARALDALVRAGACDLSDVLLVTARRETDPLEFGTLAEASMDPDLVHIFTRYANFLRVTTRAPDPALTSQARLDALEALAENLIPDGSGRREALRTVLLRLHGALAAVLSARSLSELATGRSQDPDIISSLEMFAAALAQLTSGARTRLEPLAEATQTPAPFNDQALSLAISRVLQGVDARLDPVAIAAWSAELSARIPKGLASFLDDAARHLVRLPKERPNRDEPARVVVEAHLPSWLPARRTLGGFYVLRPLGKGAVGSVFICSRAEDRNDPDAERFALKVPEYSASAARSLSETEFLELFRSEASALMQVPQHPNLARFVTFDVGARPKPILVMELVEGTILERSLASRSLDMPRALRVLDDMLAGLEAMHGVGVAHLDLKPSNVVLRKDQEAVLVDFGLAGRNVRPGCATGPYGAPEVWGAVSSGTVPSATAADVYAFGCLAFETLTGRVLFEADNEIGQIAMHVAHDGLPPGVKALGAEKGLSGLVELLFGALRRDPGKRPSISRVRAQMREVGRELASRSWPVASPVR